MDAERPACGEACGEGGRGVNGREETTAHAPCPHRLYREVEGVPMAMCGAIGFEKIGDLPCEYCHEARLARNAKRKRKVGAE